MTLPAALMIADTATGIQQPERQWGDQWLRVSEKLLRGLNHQFTNRLTALGALLDLMQPGVVTGEEVVTALSEEVERLGRLLRMYRSLGADRVDTVEATRLQDVLPVAVALHELHPDLKYLSCRIQADGDAAPVLVRQSSLLRAVLVLLESVAGNALRAGGERQMQVTYGSAAEEAFVRFEGDAPAHQLLQAGEGSLLHAVRLELAHASGTAEGMVRRADGRSRILYEIRLPTLSAARQAGRA